MSYIWSYRWSCMLIAVVSFCGCFASAQSLLITKEIGDKRFTPVDALHATCRQSVLLSFQSPETLQKISLVLGYDPYELTILGRERNQFSSSQAIIGNRRLNYDLEESLSGGKTLLTSLSLQTSTGLSQVTFSLQTGSYVITDKQVKKMLTANTFVLPVASVSECQPDSTPPRIQLISPSVLSQKIMSGSSIQFRIIDEGKGVDRDRVFAELAGYKYTLSTQGAIRSGDVFVLTPRGGLPYNTGVVVRISASDLQQYGGANTSVEQYALQTAVKPEMCEIMGCPMSSDVTNSVVIHKIVLNPLQCNTLLKEIQNMVPVAGMIQEFGCTLSGFIPPSPHSVSYNQSEKLFWLMVLGWFLFVCAMLLAFLYRSDYVSVKTHQSKKIFT